MRYILSIFLVFGCLGIQAQKYTHLIADFSILQKNTAKDTSFLVVGQVSYDMSEDLTTYDIFFPQKGSWEFRDSIMTVFDSLHVIQEIDTVGSFSELSMFKKILEDDLSDFGLTGAGFKIEDVQKAENSVVFKWKPPTGLDFIDQVISKKEDNNLTGLIVIDEEGFAIHKTFYEDYTVVNNISVPTIIKTKMGTKDEQLIKEIQLRNVVIN